MKLFHVISTSILGAAMAIGVGLAVANTQRAMKAEAATADTTFTTTTSGDFDTSTNVATKDGITCTINLNGGSWQSGHVRIFGSGTIAFSSSNTISKIVFTYARTQVWAITTGGGSFTSDYTTWTGSASSLLFTNTAEGQFRISSIVVTQVVGPAQSFSVTYSAGANGSGSYVHADQPEGSYQLLPFDDLTGVSASTGYRFKNYTVGGADKNPGESIDLDSAKAVTVNFEQKPLEATYDFTKNWTVYAKDWGGYAPHTISGTDVGAEYDGVVSFTNVSKQSTDTATIKDRPVIAAKSGVTSTMSFVLDNIVAASYKITSVNVNFLQWGTKKLAVALYKGTTASGTALDSFSASDTPRTLSTANLNGDSFIVDFSTTNSSNVQLGITSIVIQLAAKASFGTLDHIKVTSLPNSSIYHVDEYFDPTGLQVTAYDGADEATASYKDVTDHIDTLIDNTYQFVDGDVPGFDVDVEYTESAVTKTASYHLDVYAKAEYELVTSEPTDWSGNYLLVASYTDSGSVTHTVAINSALMNFDQPLNFKEVTITGNEIITGQECEFAFAKYNSGYSMQGKNGKYAYGSSSNRFMTSDTAQELALSFDSNIVTVTGGGGFFLKMNSSTAGAERFGFYDKGSADISFYKLKASDDADTYAQLFLETLSTGSSAVCHYDPDTHIVSTDLDELRIAWKLLAEEYDTSLSASDKEQFRLGVASEDPSASNIAKALALYDHIVNAYGEQLKSGEFTNYNFMNRSYGLQPGQVSVTSHLSNNVVITIVIITSVIALTSVGCFFIIRRKKHN